MLGTVVAEPGERVRYDGDRVHLHAAVLRCVTSGLLSGLDGVPLQIKPPRDHEPHMTAAWSCVRARDGQARVPYAGVLA
jgi:hypothetical protein